MTAAMVDLFSDSFAQVSPRSLLDTEDRAHDDQQVSLFNANDDRYRFLPIDGYKAGRASPWR